MKATPAMASLIISSVAFTLKYTAKTVTAMLVKQGINILTILERYSASIFGVIASARFF
jgi:hypothetical protein